MRSLSSKPKNTYSKPLGYSGKATSTFSNIFVVIIFQRCQSTNYSSMWEISVEVVCAPVREKIKPSCERRQAIYRASLTISDPASSPWPPATSSLALPWFTAPAPPAPDCKGRFSAKNVGFPSPRNQLRHHQNNQYSLQKRLTSTPMLV